MRSVAVAVWALLGGLTFVVSLLAGTTSVAHAANSLQESTPAADSTINQPPTQIVLTFENPTGTGTIIQLVCGGDPITVGTVQVAGNVATLPVLGDGPRGRLRGHLHHDRLRRRRGRARQLRLHRRSERHGHRRLVPGRDHDHCAVDDAELERRR